MISKTEIGLELLKVIASVGGTIYHQRVADKVKEIRKSKLMNDGPLLERLILELAKMGYLTV